MDRAGRRFRMSNVDAMGYDARTSDPLYKHIPFYITHDAGRARRSACSTTPCPTAPSTSAASAATITASIRGFTADHGDLDYYVIAGPRVADVTRRFTWLTGRPAFLPRWALGYSGSTMSYTDAPDAQARMAEFLDSAQPRHPVRLLPPVVRLHLDRRAALRLPLEPRQVPRPGRLRAQLCRRAGVRLCANIKPCLLDDHPLFEEARTGAC